MKQTVSGNIKCFDISCSDEDVKRENAIESAIEKIWDKVFVDEYFEQLKVLKELKESGNNG